MIQNGSTKNYCRLHSNFQVLDYSMKDMNSSKNLLEKNSDILNFKSISTDDNVAKVSVVGMGMMSQSGVAEKMFQTLGNHKINILAISTSEIKISVLIRKKYTEDAVKSLHSAYKLDK